MAGIERLKRRSEFLRVAATRRKWVTPGLILQAAPRAPGDAPEAAAIQPARIGYTASKKVGIAVARNRARRRLRAAVTQLLPLHAAPAHDYVLVARADTVTRPFAELLRDLETALRRLGVYRDGAGPSETGQGGRT